MVASQLLPVWTKYGDSIHPFIKVTVGYFRARLGNYYELAFKYVQANPAFHLVHGYIVYGRSFSVEQYRGYFNPFAAQSYPASLLSKKIKQYNHYGAWHDHPIREEN
jgi:hypothetical protein